MWVAAHNGHNYKLAVMGDKRDKAMIDAAPQFCERHAIALAAKVASRKQCFESHEAIKLQRRSSCLCRLPVCELLSSRFVANGSAHGFSQRSFAPVHFDPKCRTG